ncbi:serine hydrolase domain-containing protein [Flexithrix dorotheae]|uniref:serine hydrolase domain-containing protein n=1 Tax=Flexithrix dorotheae TaxID=70993 RepID=UPI000374C1F6|nr:serine hydrolase domain-containing protein [Flexithrix dorotheae]
MKNYLTLVLPIVLVLIQISCSEDDPAPAPVVGTYTSASAFLEEIEFSGSILIRKGNKDIVRSGFGMADKSTNIFNSTAHIYRIGSMTKAFTAIGIVNLKRDGFIQSYDQPISDFIDDFPKGNKITLRHLLTHYSGIPDYFAHVDPFSQNQNVSISTEDILDLIVEVATTDGLLFEPGAEYSYSNSNYFMLGLLIEDLTGMSYHEYLNQKIMEPLGLSTIKEGPNEMTDESYAKGYKDGVEVAPYPMHFAFSAGDLISNIEDMEKWGDALLGNQFLTEEEKSEVFVAAPAEDGYYAIGFGWNTMRENGNLMYFHGGDIDGYSSLIALLPESNSLIVVLGNEEDGGTKRNLILEALTKHEFQFN